MRKALVLIACALVVAGTASAGVAVFNGVRAEFADDNSTVVYHPGQIAEAATIGGSIHEISSPGDGSGFTISSAVPGKIYSFYFSTTGAATNAALLQIPDTDNYEMNVSFVCPDAGWNAVNLRFDPAITYNTLFGATVLGGGNNIDLASVLPSILHEGHKVSPEFQRQNDGIQFRCWDDTARGFYTVNPALTVEGVAHNLAAANLNRITFAHFEGKQVTFRAVKDNTAGTLAYYMTIADNPDFGTETWLFTVPAFVPAALGHNDAGGPDVPHVRYRGQIVNAIFTFTGDSVPNVNAGALGISLPSMDVPFFVEK